MRPCSAVLISWILSISCLLPWPRESQAKSYSFSNHSMSAYQAWYYCACINETLGTVKNSNESQNLTSQIGNSSGWIGLYRIPFVKQLVWMDGSARGIYEIDRIDVPKPSKGKHCVYINASHHWIAANCFEQQPAICEGNRVGLLEDERCYNQSQRKSPSRKPVKKTTTPSTIAFNNTLDTGFQTTNFPPTTETGPLLTPTSSVVLTAETTSETTQGSTATSVTTSGQDETTPQQTVLFSSTVTTPVERTTSEMVIINRPTFTFTTESSLQVTHTDSATESSTNTRAIAATYTSSNKQTDTSPKVTYPNIMTTPEMTSKGWFATVKSNQTITSKPSTSATTTTSNQQQTNSHSTAHQKSTSINSIPTTLITSKEETSARESAQSTTHVTSSIKSATTKTLSNGVEIPNVRVTRLTSKDNRQYNEANPLAELPSTKINKLVPQGLGENDRFTAVIAQFKNERNLLQTLSNASEYPNSGYDDTVLVFNSTPILSLTALIEEPRRKLNASASFDFNLTQDSTLDMYAKSRSFALGDFYKDTSVVRKLYYECRYVDTQRNVLASDGCVSRETGQMGLVRCECAHTTSFAVLLSISSFTVPSSVKILSFITESISTVFLIITLIVLVKLRKSIRNDRTLVQINLTIALLLFHVCNLFHDPAQQNYRSCEMIAVLTHFFILASAAWMLLEGVILAHKTIGGVMDSRATKKAKAIRLVVGWGVPAFVVFIAAVAGFSNDTYMQKNPVYVQTVRDGQSEQQPVPRYSTCWLNRESGTLIGAVITPVLLVLFVNTAIVCRMGCFVYKMSLQAENFKPSSQRQTNSSVRSKHPTLNMHHLLASVKAVAFLIPTLGLPWVLGVFAGAENYEASVAFMYLNSIVNGLQGVMIFVIYCVLGREVRKAIESKWKRVRAGSQQHFSEDKSHSSYKKDSTLQKKKARKASEPDLIFGVHQSTYGKFVELPRY